jgi:uncharacterized membrane protein YhaH (DUF805 family)
LNVPRATSSCQSRRDARNAIRGFPRFRRRATGRRVPARAPAASERHSETVRAGTNTVRIGEGLRHCLRETRNIKGRTSKEAFGSYLLVVMALAAAIAFVISIVQPLLTTTRFVTVSGIYMPMPEDDFDALYALIALGSVPLLVALVPLSTAAVRRLHDTGRSWVMVGIAYGLYALWIVMIIYGDVTTGSLGGVGLIATMGGMSYYLTRPSELLQNAYGPVTSI